MREFQAWNCKAIHVDASRAFWLLSPHHLLFPSSLAGPLLQYKSLPHAHYFWFGFVPGRVLLKMHKWILCLSNP